MLARGYPVQKLIGVSYDRKLKICCPIHNERTPSFQIYPDGSFYCFGCAAHGNGALDLLICMGEEFKMAVNHLTNA